MSDYGSNFDRETWQAEQAARDEVETAYRDKMAKARARSAANAKRKIARLHFKLTELGHISEFEDEFGESVLERLDKYGSAFHDREKGRAGDALSTAQKQVVSRMNKKLKELKAKQKAGEATEVDPDADYVRTADRWKKDANYKSGFKSKRKSRFTPRVRNIEDELIEAELPPSGQPLDQSLDQKRPINPAPLKLVSAVNTSKSTKKEPPYIPKYTPASTQGPTRKTPAVESTAISDPKRPFLRIVPKADD